MAKLYFYYSAMNAGKSTNLLQSSHNYQERGMKTLLLTPAIDQRAGIGKIASRIGLEAVARTFHQDDDLLTELKTICHCGCKATMNLRTDEKGNAIKEGSQVEIGGNERYVAMCRKHFRGAMR